MDLFRLNCGMSVHCYGYRTAHIRNIFMTLDRYSDTGREIEKTLCEEAGVERDNHVTYAIKNRNGTVIYIACSDRYIHIGTEIDIGRW